jgi:hypothetical protein
MALKKEVCYDTIMENILSKINKIKSCWIWLGSKSGSGYGRMQRNNKKYFVHRFVYEIYKGKIPEGYEVDHLCRKRDCVNPEHLEAVTMKENRVRAGNTRRKDFCKHGHPFSGGNLRLYFNKKRNKFIKECRKCHYDYNKSWRLKNSL